MLFVILVYTSNCQKVYFAMQIANNNPNTTKHDYTTETTL